MRWVVALVFLTSLSLVVANEDHYAFRVGLGSQLAAELNLQGTLTPYVFGVLGASYKNFFLTWVLI